MKQGHITKKKFIKQTIDDCGIFWSVCRLWKPSNFEIDKEKILIKMIIKLNQGNQEQSNVK